MVCNLDPHDCGLIISAIPVGTEAVELGELVDGGGDNSPRVVVSFADGLWRKAVGGDRGRESRGYLGCKG